jgi:hypothetical protein
MLIRRSQWLADDGHLDADEVVAFAVLAGAGLEESGENGGLFRAAEAAEALLGRFGTRIDRHDRRPPHSSLLLQPIHHRSNVVERVLVGGAITPLESSDLGLEIVVIQILRQLGDRLGPDRLVNEDPEGVVGA